MNPEASDKFFQYSKAGDIQDVEQGAPPPVQYLVAVKTPDWKGTCIRGVAVVIICCLAAVTIAGVVLSKVNSSASGNSQISKERPIVILVSIDGFRHDYSSKWPTPVLDQIRRSGINASSLISVFPSKTFPNHYSIVTGLYPESHGIVSNNMYDPALGHFQVSNASSLLDPRWWGGTPLWVLAEQQGLRTGTVFWVGSNIPIQGVLPSHYLVYNGSMPYHDRIDTLLHWLDIPLPDTPQFLTLYFEHVDDMGHRDGPNSDKVGAAVVEVDAALGYLVEGLATKGLLHKVNIIVLSDHGFTQLSEERVVLLDDFIDISAVHVTDYFPVLGLFSDPANQTAVLQSLQNMSAHVNVHTKETVPARLHYSNNVRIPHIIGICELGWAISHHSEFDTTPWLFSGGQHGYDPEEPDMHAIFAATGPAFQSGLQVDTLRNIDVYELVAHILRLTPAPNNGSLAQISHVLR